MYEGQQIVQAVFRFAPTAKRKSNVGVLQFDANGEYHFVGNPDTYEGVRNLLRNHGMFPVEDPLEAAVIVPADAVKATGTGKVTPPSDDFSDLDDFSDIKALKNGASGSSETETNLGASNQSDPSRVSAATDQELRPGSNRTEAPAQGVDASSSSNVAQDQIDDADFGIADEDWSE